MTKFLVNGERNPADVYKDFRAGVLKILGMQGSMVGPLSNGSGQPVPEMNGNLVNGTAITHAALTAGAMHEVHKEVPATAYKPPAKGFPPVVWVIGKINIFFCTEWYFILFIIPPYSLRISIYIDSYKLSQLICTEHGVHNSLDGRGNESTQKFSFNNLRMYFFFFFCN